MALFAVFDKIQDGGWRPSWIYKNGHNFWTALPIDVMFGCSMSFSGWAVLMVQLSVTLSDPEPQFQGHVVQFKGKYLANRACHGQMYQCFMCPRCVIYYSEDNITSFSNDMNVARSLSNSWASCFRELIDKILFISVCFLQFCCSCIWHMTDWSCFCMCNRM